MIEITSNRATNAIQLTGCKPPTPFDLLDTTNHLSTMGRYIQPYQQKVTVSATPKEHSPQSGNDRVVKGIRGLAKYLGCGVNKAQQIMNSGVLVESKIAYKIGKTWLINREKLTLFLEDNPMILEKLSTKS